MRDELEVFYEGKPCYKILLRQSFDDFLPQFQDNNIRTDRKVCIVTDSNVADLYLNDVLKICHTSFSKVEFFVFDAGESSKNLAVVQKLYEHLIKCHFDRKDLLLALGGGVVGDLTGFTAATYLRGIDFIQMPTTLLSQVDSSIGGKTGVDFLQYKNMVGAFYMPRMVYINIATLRSLSAEQFASGMGEVVKHGFIRDDVYYHYLTEHRDAILERDMLVLQEMVYGSCAIKKAVVEEDPKEQGIRAYLNFGHTIGHAIEKLSDFKLSHGACVAIGMHGALYLSKERALLSEEDYQEALSVISSFSLPTFAPGYVVEDVLLATKTDKKMVGGQIKFVLLDAIGNAITDTSVTEQELRNAIAEVVL